MKKLLESKFYLNSNILSVLLNKNIFGEISNNLVLEKAPDN